MKNFPGIKEMKTSIYLALLRTTFGHNATEKGFLRAKTSFLGRMEGVIRIEDGVHKITSGRQRIPMWD